MIKSSKNIVLKIKVKTTRGVRQICLVRQVESVQFLEPQNGSKKQKDSENVSTIKDSQTELRKKASQKLDRFLS